MEQSELLRFACTTLDRLNVRHLVTGSQATIAFGEPRFTNDIDILVELNLDQVSELLAAFPAPEYYVSEATARNEVRRRGMFNIIHPSSGLKLDLMMADDSEYDRQRLLRAVRIPVSDDYDASFASPEDVILKKLQWFQMTQSDRHLRDIFGVLKVQGAVIDKSYVECWVDRLGVATEWQLVTKQSTKDQQHD